ncbi:MAG: hypothetical protein HOU81_11245 [Hamadaea sp.]|uniref:type VII secretion target n=1 Tax=Hamadaea sp. TaxID=2024425 RepID=UPI0018187A9F|nr:type VII secretion target [Hamadaea sp.]NUR71387.1 hypothetical protein [Hamadaea sp.]NUT22684.1 hypothetical protein [Hamadaea sp.]
MSVPIEVVSTGLRLASDQLNDVAGQADQMIQQFIGEIESLGECWGDDDLGSAMGAIYKAALALVINSITSNLDTLDDYAERLGVAADNYDDADMSAVERMTKLASGGPSLSL